MPFPFAAFAASMASSSWFSPSEITTIALLLVLLFGSA
jgi:hypothetical protein